jgi:hypothetical protein
VRENPHGYAKNTRMSRCKRGFVVHQQRNGADWGQDTYGRYELRALCGVTPALAHRISSTRWVHNERHGMRHDDGRPIWGETSDRV